MELSQARDFMEYAQLQLCRKLEWLALWMSLPWIAVGGVAAAFASGMLLLGILAETQPMLARSLFVLTVLAGMVLGWAAIRQSLYGPGKLNTTLPEQVTHNLTTGGILLASLRSDPYAELPSLQVVDQLYPGVPAPPAHPTLQQESIEQRLRRLAKNYELCCKDLKLEPFPASANNVRGCANSWGCAPLLLPLTIFFGDNDFLRGAACALALLLVVTGWLVGRSWRSLQHAVVLFEIAQLVVQRAESDQREGLGATHNWAY